MVLGAWGWCLLGEREISFAHLHWYPFCILTPSHWGFLTWFTALSFISLQLWRGKGPWTVWGRRVCHLPRRLYLPGELHVLELGKADSVGDHLRFASSETPSNSNSRRNWKYLMPILLWTPSTYFKAKTWLNTIEIIVLDFFFLFPVLDFFSFSWFLFIVQTTLRSLK